MTWQDEALIVSTVGGLIGAVGGVLGAWAAVRQYNLDRVRLKIAIVPRADVTQSDLFGPAAPMRFPGSPQRTIKLYLKVTI